MITIRRYLIFALCYAIMPAILGGLVAVYQAFGLGAMCGALGLLYLFYFGTLHLVPASAGGDDPWEGFFDAGIPRLPSGNSQRLPAPGPPRIGRSQRQALPPK